MTAFMGSVSDFDTFLYPPDNPANLGFFQQSLANVIAPVHAMGNAFMDSVKRTYDKFYGSEAMRAARNAIKMAQKAGMNNEQYILQLNELQDIQTASLTMQRWIMAAPEVRDLYHRQLCDGFNDTYVDMDPGVTREEHYDYRRVTDGVLMFDEDGDWKINHYAEDLRPGDRDLDMDEKVDILNTWDILAMFVEAGKDDPTSPYGGML